MMDSLTPWGISPEEEALAARCLESARRAGASAARVTVNKSVMDLCLLRNGVLDKVSRSADRSFTCNLFADRRYGTFSTNRLTPDSLDAFLGKAVGTVRRLAPDPFRRLPDPERTVRTARTGRELDLYDPDYATQEAAGRLERVRRASVFESAKAAERDYTLITEETEYAESAFDQLILDTNGLRCRHTESVFEIGCEVTAADPEGNRYSGTWWEGASRRAALLSDTCCSKALERARSQFHPRKHPGGKMPLVVDTEVAGRLVSPLLAALGAFSIQQGNSFLRDTLGRRVLSPGLTLEDRPLQAGATGARLFDSEGVAAADRPIIREGVVETYFVNTYMSGKLGLAPTVEEAIRPVLLPLWPGPMPEKADTDALLGLCGTGILVTGFNGGNSNSATGDFSYGIEGFAFRDGRILYPVREMVITGNFLTLWNNLLAAGNDARPCAGRRIPSLAFRAVDFSG